MGNELKLEDVSNIDALVKVRFNDERWRISSYCTFSIWVWWDFIILIHKAERVIFHGRKTRVMK